MNPIDYYSKLMENFTLPATIKQYFLTKLLQMNIQRKLLLPVLVCAMTACNNSGKESQQNNADSATGNTAAQEAPGANTQTPAKQESTFDINNLPVSTASFEKFPYFSMPEDIKPLNRPIERKYDQLFFPIDGKMVPLQGKVYKTYLTPASNRLDDWSLIYVLKSYDDAIKSVGGVKISDSKVSKEELDRIKDEATYFGEDGSIDYYNEPVKVYAIHRENGDNIYIQIAGNTAGGSIQILQEAPFKQTISLLKADELKKEIEQKGKAIVYINFDTDKASLQASGKEAVDEIAKLLQQESGWKLSVNGYTDNTGSADHNLELSQARAKSVVDALVSKGITADRLTAKGFGQEQPIAPNDNEAGKAKNRRVELVKM